MPTCRLSTGARRTWLAVRHVRNNLRPTIIAPGVNPVVILMMTTFPIFKNAPCAARRSTSLSRISRDLGRKGEWEERGV